MIPGATTELELQWLGNAAEDKKCIVEIGSYYGRSTVALAAKTKGIVIAVDDFFGPRDVELSPEERQRIYDKFIENTASCYNIKSRICSHEQFEPPSYCDMAFIDGDHKYENVLRDIKKFLHLKKVLITGHDYYWWPGVMQAVNDIFGNQFSLVDHTQLWYVDYES